MQTKRAAAVGLVLHEVEEEGVVAVVLGATKYRGLSTTLRFGRDDGGLGGGLGRDDGRIGVLERIVVGEAGGADAGLVVEGWDFEAGVVCEDEQAGGGQRVGDGFEVGVALEGGSIFGRLGELFEIGEGENVNPGDAGAGGELGQLTGVGGGGVENHDF